MLTATAAPGYSFTNWTENGVPVSTSTSYSFIVVNDRVLAANLKFPEYIQSRGNPDSFDIYPNPSNSILMKQGVSGKFTVSILNQIGETLLCAANIDRMDVSRLANGLYFIQIRTADAVVT